MSTDTSLACPRCGFAYGWDGASCRHCRYPAPVPEPPPPPPEPEYTEQELRARELGFPCGIDERGFLQAIRANPDDEVTRLVYADWLDEHDDPRGAFLRVESKLANLSHNDKSYANLKARCEELAAEVDQRWLDHIGWMRRRSRILNCGSSRSRTPTVRFSFRCPNRWGSLTPTDEDGVRFCDDCRRQVFYCEARGEAERHAREGRCIAITAQVAGKMELAHASTIMGMLKLPKFSLPMIDEASGPYETWGRAIFEPPPQGRQESATRKRWWQFWK